MAYRDLHTRLLASGIGAGLIAASGSSALGQEYQLRLEPSASSVDMSTGTSTITVDVIGDMFDPSEHEYMLWGSFALQTSGAAVSDIVWEHASWSEYNHSAGYTNDGNFGMVEFGQWEYTDGWMPNNGSAIGSRIGSFTLTVEQGVVAGEDLSINLVHAGRYALSTIDIDSGQSYYSTPESLLLGDATIQIVPAPSSAICLLGLGVWGSSRRRSRGQGG